MSLSPSATGRTSSRRRLAIALMMTWIIGLIGLAFWTANPVTLNVDQLLLARATGVVVMASVVDASKEVCKVEEVMTQAVGVPVDVTVGHEIVVKSLGHSGAKTGDRVILPLLVGEQGDQLQIAPTRFRTTPSYPATPELVEEVKHVIERKNL